MSRTGSLAEEILSARVGETTTDDQEVDVARCEVQQIETCFVEDQLRQQKSLEGVKCWHVIYVKSHYEFITAAELIRKGIEAYLPAIRKVRQWKDRKKLIDYPLFPGYVFVQVPAYPGAFLEVLKTRGVVTFVSLEAGTPTPVADEEIDTLKILTESSRNIDVYPELREGMRIRMKSGPLKGAQGVLSKKEDEIMFLVNIELLGRSVAVRVIPEDVEVY